MLKPKTSGSDPLRIDQVSLDGARGRIGLTFCPGKKQEFSQTGPWDRDLNADLKAIQSFGAAALVTLMEDHELREVKVLPDQLEAGASAHGMEWHHLPIRDVSIPDKHFEDLWIYSGLRLRKLLSQGQNIVIHCRGGLGRTGMIAARLLVEFGLEPDVAIRRVRAARPGSIETRDQEKNVLGSRKVALPGAAPIYSERFLGCLLGGAVGDAFGYCVEFLRLPEIRSTFGPEGIKEPVYQKGKLVVSDDTQMTLFTLEGILNGLKEPSAQIQNLVESIRLSYLDWLGTMGKSYGGAPKRECGWLAHCLELNVPRAPGTTCVSSLMHGGHGTIENRLNDKKGCGGAMRSAPVGLFRRFDPMQAFELGARSAAITHGHPSGYLSAGMVSAIVRCLMDGMDIYAATEKSLQILQGWGGHEETLHAITKALVLAKTDSGDHPKTIHSIGGGWVGEEALAIALYAILTAGSYVDAIRTASNHDGDSDSTASIAGQFWGAWKGLMEIPHEWITKLDVLVPVLRLARETLENASVV
jgi:ADP-ribosylglycohydrolase/protein-tyrosine phosphatase